MTPEEAYDQLYRVTDCWPSLWELIEARAEMALTEARPVV